MNNDIVTLGYLKEFTKGVLKLNKGVVDTSDNIVVTYDDVVNGIYYPYFKDNINPKSIISGLHIKETDLITNVVKKEQLSLIFPKLMNIEITCDDINMSPCGDKKELITYANFNIMQRLHDGEQLIKKLNCEINPILRKQDKEDTLFTLEGHFCSIDENLTNEDRKTIITASYAYKNEIKNASIELIQNSNELTDWIFSHNTTESLEISGSNTLIPKEGGECVITVKRVYTKHYYKLDSCGNKVVESTQENNVDDISKICQYNSTNGNVFHRSINVISVDKQEIGGNKRYCIVNVEYDGCNASLTIEQEKGSESSYTYSLAFYDDSIYGVKTLKNSIASSFVVRLKSLKNMMVDGELYSSIPSYDLNFVKYDPWFEVEILGIDEDGFINVKFTITSNNESKISDRETEVEIYNAHDVENRIKLLIRQPKNKCLKTEYDLITEGERYFTYDTIKRAKIALKPFKIEHYEDGTIVKTNTLPNDFNIIVKGKSSDESVLKKGNLIKTDFDGNHEIGVKYFDVEVNYEVSLSYSMYINDNLGFRVTDIKCFNIFLKGNDIVEYTYEFYPLIRKETKNHTIVFDYDNTDEFEFYIISKQHKMVNNVPQLYDIFKKIEFIGDTEYFNVSIVHGDTIIVKPKQINESNEPISKQIKFVQETSCNEILINLVQNGKPSERYKDIEVSVTIHKDNVIEDLWYNATATMYVTDTETNKVVYELGLQSWWLSSYSDTDTIYKGMLSLKIDGTYNFYIDEMYMNNFNKKYETFEIKLDETYSIEDDDEGIDLIVNI